MVFKAFFPNLHPYNHRVTSPKDESYNCVAWAMGDSDSWMQPHHPYVWPGDYLPLTEEPGPEDVAEIFEAEGFERCDSPKLEEHYERLAIYAVRDRFTHISRQLKNGWWASKVGDLEDIEHATLGVLEGGAYGYVAVVLRRSQLWARSLKTPET